VFCFVLFVLIFVFEFSGCSLLSDFSINASKIDEPKVDEPIVDEPKVDEPIVDEPIVDEQKVDEPNENNDVTIIGHSYSTIDVFNTIPLQWINNASDLHIFYGHTSPGSQLVDGMAGLINFLNDIESGKGDNYQYSDDVSTGMQLSENWNDLDNPEWGNLTCVYIEQSKRQCDYVVMVWTS